MSTLYILRFEGVHGEEVKPIYDALEKEGCGIEVFRLNGEGREIALITSPNGFSGGDLEGILGDKEQEIPPQVDWDCEEFVKVVANEK